MTRVSRLDRRAYVDAVNTATVAIRAITLLIEVGVGAGVRRELLTETAGVSDKMLQDPDARVPIAAEIALWQTVATHSSDPELGVRAGQAYRLRPMGLVGYVARFSATLRGAMQRVERYSRVFTEAVTFRMEESRPQIGLAQAHPSLGPGQALAESYRLAAVLQASRELTEVDIVPARVNFT